MAVASPAPEAKKSFWQSVVEYYHLTMAEMRKVTWPDATQVRQATVAITVFVLLLGLVIWLLDLLLQGVLVRLIPSLFGAR